jgi:hypothetical protein
MFRRHDLAISRRSFLRGLLAAGSGLAGVDGFSWAAATPERLIVAMSVGVDSINPYGHGDAPLYGLWGHVMDETDFNAGKYGMYMFGRGSITDPEAFYIRYFRSGRGKRLAYRNQEFDKLFDQQSETFDGAKREELLRQMGRILHEDCPVIPLYNTADVYALRKDLIWKPRPDEKIPLVNARFQN